MKPLLRGHRLYWNERSDVDNDHHISSFSHLMGLQSVHIGNMIQSRRNNNMNGVLHHWNRLVKLNNRWVSLVLSPFYGSPDIDQERLDRLRRVTSDMSHGYTSTIAELILNGKVNAHKLDNVINAEAQFFSTVLGKSPSLKTASNVEYQTRQQWHQHTGSIIDLLRVAQPNVQLGEVYDDEAYHYAAANCIIHGKLLGRWLDGVFLEK